uniref:Uncharacterized protein n=1 Tax=Arundo donax TaxID=35708 RepID=A0A0A9F4B7_ARUDO
MLLWQFPALFLTNLLSPLTVIVVPATVVSISYFPVFWLLPCQSSCVSPVAAAK